MINTPPSSDLLAGCKKSTREIALVIGVSDELVRLWRRRLRRVPAERVRSLERVTGVPSTVLRPDLYPQDGEAA